jgi:hypothetical protein
MRRTHRPPNTRRNTRKSAARPQTPSRRLHLSPRLELKIGIARPQRYRIVGGLRLSQYDPTYTSTGSPALGARWGAAFGGDHPGRRPATTTAAPQSDPVSQGEDRSMTTTQRRIVPAVTAACVAAILAPALETHPVWGQSRAPNADEGIPHREGNVYDHKRHQPTQAEVEAAAKATGADPLPSSAARRDSDIESLRQEIERIEQAYPPPSLDDGQNRRR